MPTPAMDRRCGAVSRRPTARAPYAGVVREVGDDWLLFDFNHPLAGQAVVSKSY